MNSKIKILSIIFVSLIIGMVIYLPFTNAVQSEINLGDQTTIEMEEYRHVDQNIHSRVRFVLWFLKNSEPFEIDGSVVYLKEKMLILNTDKNQVRVHLPAEWTVETELFTRQELFSSGYLNSNQMVSIKALRADVINKEGLRIYLLVGYELTNELDVHACANIPINIET